MNAWLRFKSIGLALGVVIVLYGVRQNQGTAEEAVIKAYPVAAQFEFQVSRCTIGVGKIFALSVASTDNIFPCVWLAIRFCNVYYLPSEKKRDKLYAK